ncbi:hypothetical protein QE375_000307 [Microbacterium foliorum]|uniref:Uncharacterized protein n=1 Tax=Microbacterium foliorum TaxID=104336 RepID=A0ABU1HMA4_9MICO|nr:hypothetical protein [Microbacterium foliorum]
MTRSCEASDPCEASGPREPSSPTSTSPHPYALGRRTAPREEIPLEILLPRGYLLPKDAGPPRQSQDAGSSAPPKKSPNWSVASKGRIAATYWSGRTTITTPSRDSSRASKMSVSVHFDGPAA